MPAGTCCALAQTAAGDNHVLELAVVASAGSVAEVANAFDI
jgi:hypothetical protein